MSCCQVAPRSVGKASHCALQPEAWLGARFVVDWSSSWYMLCSVGSGRGTLAPSLCSTKHEEAYVSQRASGHGTPPCFAKRARPGWRRCPAFCGARVRRSKAPHTCHSGRFLVRSSGAGPCSPRTGAKTIPGVAFTPQNSSPIIHQALKSDTQRPVLWCAQPHRPSALCWPARVVATSCAANDADPRRLSAFTPSPGVPLNVLYAQAGRSTRRSAPLVARRGSRPCEPRSCAREELAALTGISTVEVSATSGADELVDAPARLIVGTEAALLLRERHRSSCSWTSINTCSLRAEPARKHCASLRTWRGGSSWGRRMMRIAHDCPVTSSSRPEPRRTKYLPRPWPAIPSAALKLNRNGVPCCISHHHRRSPLSREKMPATSPAPHRRSTMRAGRSRRGEISPAGDDSRAPRRPASEERGQTPTSGSRLTRSTSEELSGAKVEENPG